MGELDEKRKPGGDGFFRDISLIKARKGEKNGWKKMGMGRNHWSGGSVFSFDNRRGGEPGF
jgi:hypothetical protein